MLDYTAFNHEVFARVPSTAKSILDVGCGTGVMGKSLKEANTDRQVYGITYSEPECEVAVKVLDKVLVSDLNQQVPAFDERFDCIILSHILEHTFYPDRVLKSIAGYLKKDGVVIIALPNVLQFKQRMKFFKGEFKYSTTGGLMDDTHFRFFDWEAAQDMVAKAGLRIIDKQSSGNFPLAFLRKVLPAVSTRIDRYALKKWPGLFGFQFIFIAVKD